VGVGLANHSSHVSYCLMPQRPRSSPGESISCQPPPGSLHRPLRLLHQHTSVPGCRCCQLLRAAQSNAGSGAHRKSLRPQTATKTATQAQVCQACTSPCIMLQQGATASVQHPAVWEVRCAAHRCIAHQLHTATRRSKTGTTGTACTCPEAGVPSMPRTCHLPNNAQCAHKTLDQGYTRITCPATHAAHYAGCARH
jgi:hypothetical protein